MSHQKSNRLSTLLGFWQMFGIFCLIGLIGVAWFGVLPYHTFMGDDLRLIMNARAGGYAGSFWQSFNQLEFDKYRPISTMVFAAQIAFSGDDFRLFIYVNLIIEIANACLLALITWQLSGQKPVVALVCGVMFLVARFAYYYVVQGYGQMEGLALFFCLATLGAIIAAYRSLNLRFVLLAMSAYALALYTHERYIVLGAFLIMAVVLAPTLFNGRAQQMLFAAVPMAIALSNYVIKEFVFHVPFFTGTGGTRITFSVGRFGEFMLAGAANLIGYNVGPSYLSGLSINEAGWWGLLLGALQSAPIVAIAALYVRRVILLSREGKIVELRNFVLFLALIMPLLLSASITVRQEYRFLYAPYTIVLAGIAYMLGRSRMPQPLLFILLTCTLLGGLAVNIFYRGYLNNVFFVQGLRVTDSAKARIIDHYNSETLARSAVYFIIPPEEDVVRSWFFMDQGFFQLYTGNPNMRVSYIQSIDDLQVETENMLSTLVFTLSDGQVIDVTREVQQRWYDLRARSTTLVDLTTEPCTINDDRSTSTPTGQGVFLGSWPDTFGDVQAPTIVTGFACRYNSVPVVASNELLVTAAVPYYQSDGARLYIDVGEGSQRKRLVSASLSGAPSSGRSNWRTYRAPLAAYAGQRVTLTVGVDSPEGTQTADWVVVKTLAIVMLQEQ